MELGFFSEDADICLHLAMAGSASGEDHGIDGSGSFVGSELVMGNCLKKTLFEKNLWNRKFKSSSCHTNAYLEIV